MILRYQGDIAPYGQVGDKGRIYRYKSIALLVGGDESSQFSFQFTFVLEKPYMNLMINDSTSMTTMDRNTFTMPLSTATGMLVSSS